MDSDTHPDGGVEPAVDSGTGPDSDPPLYKFDGSGSRLRSTLHTVIIVIAAFVVANVLVVLLVQPLMLAGVVPSTIEETTDLPTVVQALLFAVNFVGFILVGLVYLRLRGVSPFDADLFEIQVPGRRDAGWIVAGLVGLFALLAAASVLISLLGIESASNVASDIGQENPEVLLWFIAIALLLNAPAEEFLFRGIVQGLFRDAYGILPAVILTSGMFGVVHFLALSGSSSGIAVTLAITALLGVVLGTLYELTQNLVVPTLVHGLFNAIQFFLLYLQESGAVQAPA
jgi:membrane protease YdiL (CAAX protease family)